MALYQVLFTFARSLSRVAGVYRYDVKFAASRELTYSWEPGKELEFRARAGVVSDIAAACRLSRT